MNHAPTLLKARGKTIKQGDTSSLLVFMLRNNLNEDMLELEGKQATVTFKCDEGIAFRKTLTVTESKIQFTIDTVLAVGVYDVEVSCEGYIFPSKPYSVTIEVTQSHKEYTDVASPEEVPSVDKILQLIAQNRYDDSELRELITQLSNREDKDTVYDDRDIRERLTNIENRPEPVAYDDAPLQFEIRRLATSSEELAEKIQALEERPDVDISSIERRVGDIEHRLMDVTDYNERIVALERRPEPQGYDDSTIRERLDELESRPTSREMDLTRRSYVASIVGYGNNIRLDGTIDSEINRQRRSLIVDSLGLGVLHLDFIALTVNKIITLMTLPGDAPTPTSLIEVQTHDGSSIWINAGTRYVQGRFKTENERYIVDLIGYFNI